MKDVIFIFIVLWIGFPLLTYMFYWYELLNTGEDEKIKLFPSYSPFRIVCSGLITSIVFFPVLIFTYPLGAGRRLWIRKTTGEQRANVVLVHGLFHNPVAWLMYMYLLPRKGFNCFCVGYFPWEGTFEDIAERLTDYIQKELSSETPTIFVGHSLGGLLSGLIARSLSERGFWVKGVISLGTPFKGSKLTAFSPGKLARSLGFNSALLDKAFMILKNPPFRAVQLWSPADNMVLPVSSMYMVPDGWNAERVFPVCHTCMLYWPGVIGRVFKIIDELSLRSSRESENREWKQ